MGRPWRRYSAIARPTPSVRGKTLRPPRLAALDPQGGRAPVEVFEAECAHFADAQAEVDLTEGHGVIAAARRCRPVEAGQEHPELFVRHRAREMIESPARDVRDGGHQRRSALTSELQEPQEAAQGAGGDLGRLGATPGGVSRGEGHQILGANRLPSHGAVGELGLEEFAGVTSPIGAGGLGQAADIPEVSDVVLDSHIDGIAVLMRAQRMRGDAGDVRQVGQGRPDLIQAGRGRSGALAVGQMIVQEGIDRRSGHGLDGDVLGGEPGPEVFDGLDVLLDDARRMAPRVEVSDVEFDPVAEELALIRSRTRGRRKSWSSMDALLSGQRTVREDRGLCGPTQISSSATDEVIQAILMTDPRELRIIGNWA